MDDMDVMSGVDPDSLTEEQKRKSLRAVNITKLKRSNKLNGRMCIDGAPKHKFVLTEEEIFRTITMEELLAAMVIEVYEDSKV